MMKFMNGLTTLLEEQTACYERIYDLKKKEQELVLKGDSESLQSCVDEIEFQSESLKSLENARVDIMEAISGQYQLPSATPTMQEVLEVADPESEKILKSLTERLTDVLRRTSRVNEDNAFLIRKSLDLIDRTLEAITGASSQATIYGGDGKFGRIENATLSINQQV